MLPNTPHATTATAFISPFATQYPAGGMTSSLGNGRTEDSTAMRATIPRYPRSSRPRSSQSINCSTIEAVLPNQGHEPGVAQWGLPDLFPQPLDEREGLRAVGADGHQQASPRGELLHQGRRDGGAARGDEDRVVRRSRR